MRPLVCPLSNDKVNNSVARVVAILIIINTIVAVYFDLWYLFIPQIFDFTARAFNRKDLSIFRLAGQLIANILNLPIVAIDAEPKRFAAGVGIIFSVNILILMLFNLYIPAYVVTGMLIFAAFMEAAFAFCIGCYIYSYLIMPLLEPGIRRK